MITLSKFEQCLMCDFLTECENTELSDNMNEPCPDKVNTHASTIKS